MQIEKHFLSEDLSNLSIFYIGSQHCPPGHNYSVGYSDRYLMHYIVSGKGKFICNNTVYNLERGNAFVIGGGKDGYYEADDKEPWYYIWINFSGELITSFLHTLGISRENPIYKTNNVDRLSECFENLISLIDETNNFIVYGSFFTTLGEMIKYNANKNINIRPKNTEYVNTCKNFIKLNYANKIKVDDLCRISGIEHSYLYRLFKSQTGIGPMEYLIKFRMSKALRLLKTTNMTVAEIARAVGYEDSFAFSKMFKKLYGFSPSNTSNRENNSPLKN